jgi:uncharacterized protein (DUF488 family)
MGSMVTIWTVGHGTRLLDELVRLLRAHAVTGLADVRTIPRSRRNPQFNRETLPLALRAGGITYAHLPGLGGLRRPRPDSVNVGWKNASFRGYADHMQTAEFADGLDQLIALRHERPVAIMCAESVPWRCHRSLVADALTVRGFRVEHILSESRADAHRLTQWARVEGNRITYARQAAISPAKTLPGLDDE